MNLQRICGGGGAALGPSIRVITSIIKLGTVDAGTLADNVGVVSGRANADSLGGSAEEVAHLVGELFELVSRVRLVLLAEDLVQEDCVMRRACSALESIVGGEEEVPEASLGDIAINNGTTLHVTTPGLIGLLSRVEPGLVTLDRDDNSQLGHVLPANLRAGLADKGELCIKNLVELAFGDTITEDDDIRRRRPVLALPQLEMTLECIDESIVQHLLPSRLLPNGGGPLSELGVDTTNNTNNTLWLRSGLGHRHVRRVSDIVSQDHSPLLGV